MDSVILLNNQETFVLTGKIVSCDTETDIAIIIIDDGYESENAMAAAIPVPVSTKKVKQGTAVVTAGYPSRIDLVITTGHWNPSIYPTEYNTDVVTANAIGGNSGGPTLAINDGKVEYVGITIGLYRRSRGAPGTPYLVFIGTGETIVKQMELTE
jgi:hypothetical protein